ncbi:MAG: HPr family phosphocarrier protein [Candidatus Omnitrophica bacterium]|nr:HPr family phosphocarrier protein [Candidatus Omnitrophota bacterium]
MRFEREVTIQNKTGLHARPAALFVQIANKYDSEITVEKDGESVNGKSIMGILMLAAEKGSVVTIKAYGSDARQAVEELIGVLSKTEEDQFGGAIK